MMISPKQICFEWHSEGVPTGLEGKRLCWTLPVEMYIQKNVSTFWRRRAFMHVAKWGNSLAVRIPAKTVKALSLKEGDKVDMELTLVESGDADKASQRAQALERLRNLRNDLTQEDLKYNRDDLYRM
jgi:antitoxin MazE